MSLVQVLGRQRPAQREALRHARALLRAGAQEEAITAFEAIRASDADHREALLQLGRLYVRQGRDATAEPVLRAFLKLAPRHAEALLLLARLLVRRGDPEAEAWLRRLLKLKPRHPEGLLRLARLYAEGEEWRRAIPILRSLLAIEPDHAEAQALLDRISRARRPLHRRFTGWLRHLRSRPKPGIAEPLKAARAALASGDIAAAIRGFEAVRAFERQHVEASLELGRLYVRTGQDAAAARLRSVLEQVPQHLDARVLLSRLLLRSGPPTEAAQSLQALLAIDPGHREGLTMLAELETSRGNFAAATEAWARAWRGERDEAGQEAGEDTGDDTGLTAPAERPLGADLPADAILDRAAQAVVRQRIAAIGRYYTGTYEYYDLLLRQGSLIQDYERQVVRYLLAALDPGQPIVDIGSGFGLMAMVLGLNGRRAFGVEFDPRRAATFAAVLEAVGCRMPAVGANARLVYGAFPSAIAAPIPDGAALVFTNVAAGVPEEELRSNIRALRPHPFVLFDAERFFRKRESEAEIEHLLALFPQEGLPPPQPAFRIPDWNGSYYVIDRRR